MRYVAPFPAECRHISRKGRRPRDRSHVECIDVGFSFRFDFNWIWLRNRLTWSRRIVRILLFQLVIRAATDSIWILCKPFDSALKALQIWFWVQSERTDRSAANLRNVSAGVSAAVWGRGFRGISRPNACSGDFGLKRLLIEHLKGYRMVFMSIKFDEY